MLILFDLDGTLITSYMDNPDRDYNSWSVLPHREEMITALRSEGHVIGIVTNQAGVAFGHVTEKEVLQRIQCVLEALDLPHDTPVQVSFGHPKAKIYRYRKPEAIARRKPSGQMIRDHIANYPEAAAEGVVYVGDRPEDEAAAKDAGVDFIWEKDFFSRDSTANNYSE
jgi:D-glycero-D-manno-heptose 1,7-bisphosphate phosphatase